MKKPVKTPQVPKPAAVTDSDRRESGLFGVFEIFLKIFSKNPKVP
ncbi:MAG: hypothetical protein V4857_04405 [Pseudomonadota bacterium]